MGKPTDFLHGKGKQARCYVTKSKKEISFDIALSSKLRHKIL